MPFMSIVYDNINDTIALQLMLNQPHDIYISISGTLLTVLIEDILRNL